MESLTLQEDGPITGKAYIPWGGGEGLISRIYICFCLHVDGPIILGGGGLYAGGSAYNRYFTLLQV